MMFRNNRLLTNIYEIVQVCTVLCDLIPRLEIIRDSDTTQRNEKNMV